MKSFTGITLFILLFLFYSSKSTAQAVSINTDNSAPDGSSILDVKSSDKGILVPRMISAQRTAIETPANGLLVYDTNTQSFWFHNSTVWVDLLASTSGWSLTGNMASSTDFIGTINNQSLLLKANNLQAGKIDLPLASSFWGSLAGANNTGNFNTAIGDGSLYSNTTGAANTAVGRNALFTNTIGDNNTAIGYSADVTLINLTNATAIGYNAKVGTSNSLVLGGTGADAVNVGIGTPTPTTTLEVIGQVKITGGSPGINKVLTSDAAGLATWQSSASPAATEIAYIYNLTATTIAVEADIPFDSNGSMTSGYTHTPGSSSITVVTSGTYRICFSVTGTEPNQFTLFLNGIEVPGSTYGSGAGTQQNNGQTVFSITAGDVLTLRNHSSAAAVGLASFVGGTQLNVNASILIEKI